MSEWQSPQDYPRRETNGVKRLVGAVESMSRQVRESTANLLRTAGIYVTEAGMRIARSLVVEGDFSSTGSADITGTTRIGGATEIGGTLDVEAETSLGGTTSVRGLLRILASAVVTGQITSDNYVPGVSGWRLTASGLEVNEITLRGGIIGNDALASPVHPSVGSGVAGYPAVTVPTGWTDYAAVSIPVPPGFTRAAVTAISSAAFASNPADAVQYLVRVSGDDGPMTSVALPTATFDSATATHARLITGLSGGSVTASARMRSGAGIVSAAAINVVVSVTFFR